MTIAAWPSWLHGDPWRPHDRMCGRRSDGSQTALIYGVEELRHHHECCDLRIVPSVRVQTRPAPPTARDPSQDIRAIAANEAVPSSEAPGDFSALAEMRGGHVLALVLNGEQELAKRHVFKLSPPWNELALDLLHSEYPRAALDANLTRFDPRTAERIIAAIARQAPFTAVVERSMDLREYSVSLADVAEQFGSIDWFWPSWVPLGFVTLIAGRPGIGKSALALDLVGRYLNGLALPDGAPSPPNGRIRGVVWVDTEGSQAILCERAKRWKLPAELIRWPKSKKTPDEEMPAFRLDDVSDMEDLARLIAIQKPGLVVIDSLRGATKGDENSSEAGQPIAMLAKLARDYDVAIVVIHHLRKANQFENEGEVSLDRVRGSSAIVQFARSVIAIDTPDPDTPRRARVHVIKSNLCKAPEPMGFCFEQDGLEYEATPVRPRAETQVDKAMEMLQTHLRRGPMKATEIFKLAKTAGISRRTLETAKRRLMIRSKREGGRGGFCNWVMPAATREPRPDTDG